MIRSSKTLAVIGGIVAALSLAGVAAATPVLTLPEGFLTAAIGYVSTLFTDLYTIIALAIGLPLGFWVIRKVVGLVRAR